MKMGFQEIVALMIVAGSAFFLGNRWFGKSTTNCRLAGATINFQRLSVKSCSL